MDLFSPVRGHNNVDGSDRFNWSWSGKMVSEKINMKLKGPSTHYSVLSLNCEWVFKFWVSFKSNTTIFLNTTYFQCNLAQILKFWSTNFFSVQAHNAWAVLPLPIFKVIANLRICLTLLLKVSLFQEPCFIWYLSIFMWPHLSGCGKVCSYRICHSGGERVPFSSDPAMQTRLNCYRPAVQPTE